MVLFYTSIQGAHTLEGSLKGIIPLINGHESAFRVTHIYIVIHISMNKTSGLK